MKNNTGKTLKALREKYNLTVEDLAIKMGKNIDEIKDWEMGKKPDKNSLKNLAIIYNINYNCLMNIYIPDNIKYKFLPFDIFDLKLSEEEQMLMGNMYLKLKINSSYITVIEETNPFKLTRIVNRLVDVGLLLKKIKDDDISYQITPLGISVCETIEKHPDDLFDIQKIDNYSLLKILGSKYDGFNFDRKEYTKNIKYTPIEKAFKFLLSDNKYIYLRYEDLENRQYINTELYNFIKSSLPDEYVNIYKVESTNEAYLRKKELLKEKNININDVVFDYSYDIYIEPSKKGKEFAKYYKENCLEIKYIISTLIEKSQSSSIF